MRRCRCATRPAQQPAGAPTRPCVEAQRGQRAPPAQHNLTTRREAKGVVELGMKAPTGCQCEGHEEGLELDICRGIFVISQ